MKGIIIFGGNGFLYRCLLMLHYIELRSSQTMDRGGMKTGPDIDPGRNVGQCLWVEHS